MKLDIATHLIVSYNFFSEIILRLCSENKESAWFLCIILFVYVGGMLTFDK